MVNFEISWCLGDNYSITMNGAFVCLCSSPKEAFETAYRLADALEEVGIFTDVYEKK